MEMKMKNEKTMKHTKGQLKPEQRRDSKPHIFDFPSRLDASGLRVLLPTSATWGI